MNEKDKEVDDEDDNARESDNGDNSDDKDLSKELGPEDELGLCRLCQHNFQHNMGWKA